MANGIFISEIVGTIEDGSIEVCATADAVYHSSEKKVVVTLGAFARRVSSPGHEEVVAETWLPPGEKVTEHLPHEDAGSFARDVFHSWVKRVRASVPTQLHLVT